LPVATLVAAGNEADDGLYKPVISRTREALGEKGLLYVGDAKMAALSIRAFIHQGGDYYLVPLPLVGKVPERLEELLKRVRNRKLPLELVYREGDKKKLIALVCEVTADCRLHTEEEISWQERQLLVYSISLARKQRQGLEKRLKAAEGELRRLTLPGKGHRRWREKRALEERIKKILNKHRVKGLLRVEVLERVEVRKVRGYGGKPGREEREVWYEVKVERDEEAIGEARRRMGWRLYATNAPGELLSAEEVVLVHREAHRIERDFRRLKGKPLGLSPLYVIREDHTKGMVRLLTLALRALVLVEFEARRRLEERGEEMEGLYPGQPKRSTPRPTAEKLLRAFRNITLSMIKLPGETVCHITPLNEVQLRILELLALPPSIYENLARAALSNPP
jgi:transposase